MDRNRFHADAEHVLDCHILQPEITYHGGGFGVTRPLTSNLGGIF